MPLRRGPRIALHRRALGYRTQRAGAQRAPWPMGTFDFTAAISRGERRAGDILRVVAPTFTGMPP